MRAFRTLLVVAIVAAGLIVAAAPAHAATGDFSVSVSPSIGTANLGQSEQATVNTTLLSGSLSTIRLLESHVPAGVTVSFSPSIVNVGQSSQVTLTVAPDAQPGQYSIEIFADAGVPNPWHFTFYSLVILPRFDSYFTPAGRTIAPGTSTTAQLSTHVNLGPLANITLTPPPLPAGVTATFSPATVAPGASSTVTFTVASSVPGGDYPITVTLTSGSITQAATFDLIVLIPGSDFAFTAGPTTIGAGYTADIPITPVVTSGGSQLLHFSGYGSDGQVLGFNPAMVVTGQTTHLVWYTNMNTPPGVYTLTIRAVGASGDHIVTTTVTVQPLTTFSASLTPAQGAITLGTVPTVSATILTGLTSGPGAPIHFQLQAPVAGITATFDPPTVMPGQSSVMTLQAWGNAPLGTTALTVQAVGGSRTLLLPYALTIKTLPLFTNGGFEYGLARWTTSGPASIATQGAHGGTKALKLKPAARGDATAMQSFYVPYAQTLELWYKAACPLNTSVTVTLIDLTLGTMTNVVLPKCGAKAVWQQASTIVQGRHTYRLLLGARRLKENALTALFDDVQLS